MNHLETVTDAIADGKEKTCSTCDHFCVMNARELVGACRIWHDSAKTWPKSYDCCPHHEEIKVNGGNTDAEKR